MPARCCSPVTTWVTCRPSPCSTNWPAAGRAVLRVAVDGPEVPEALTRRADLLVDGPAGTARLIRDLVPA